MKTYKITERKAGQNQVKTIESSLTLKEAQKELLALFNRYSFSFAKNWGMAVILSKEDIDALPTYIDGTRAFNYDNKTFSIVEEKEEGDE